MPMIGNYDIIAQCNHKLKEHLTSLLKPIVKNFDENCVLFDFPTQKNLESQKVPTEKPVLGVVLFQVCPNTAFRNEESEEGYAQPHLTLNLHYLMIASALDKGMEYTMLGKIVEAFHHHPSLKINDAEEATFLPESLELSDIAALWRHLQMDSFKTFLAYQSTVKMFGRKEKPEAPLREIILKIHDAEAVDLKKPLTESKHVLPEPAKKG